MLDDLDAALRTDASPLMLSIYARSLLDLAQTVGGLAALTAATCWTKSSGNPQALIFEVACRAVELDTVRRP